MTDTPPKPKRRRWRWLVVGLLCLIGAAGWWQWPQSDARFVGTWRVGAGSTWRLTPDGKLLHIADGRPVHILNWSVSGDAFRMLPKREHWLSSAMNSLTRTIQGKKPEFFKRWRIAGVSQDSIELDPNWTMKTGESLILTRLPE